MGPLKKNRGNSEGVARILNLGLDLGLNLGLVLIRGLFVRHGCGRADHPGALEKSFASFDIAIGANG